MCYNMASILNLALVLIIQHSFRREMTPNERNLVLFLLHYPPTVNPEMANEHFYILV